jgi:predicted Zn-dependent protease
MLLNIVAIGDDVDMRGNIRAPSILLDAMTIAGQ